MIKNGDSHDLDRKKLAETYENTIDPNLLYEELDEYVDQDVDNNDTHAHDHQHNTAE